MDRCMMEGVPTCASTATRHAARQARVEPVEKPLKCTILGPLGQRRNCTNANKNSDDDDSGPE